MSTIIKRGPSQYQVEIRRKGHPRQTRTFETRAEADIWARSQESLIDKGQFRDLRPMQKITLGDALDRYMAEVVPTKALGGQRNERNRIRLLKKHPLAGREMTKLLAADFVQYRNERLAAVSSTNTVRLELALLSHLYTVAIKEWSWPLWHVMKDVSKPSPPEERERRLVGDEEQRLLDSTRSDKVKNPAGLIACIKLSLATGLRAGELLTLQWSQVDLRAGVLNLTKNLNGSRRSVGLNEEAAQLLRDLPLHQGKVIIGYTETGKLDRDFKAARIAAGIADLVFHDLRHEAATRFAPHMHPQELAKIMGWRTLQMAMRYYNPTGQELARKMREVEAIRSAQTEIPGLVVGPAANKLQPVAEGALSGLPSPHFGHGAMATVTYMKFSSPLFAPTSSVA